MFIWFEKSIFVFLWKFCILFCRNEKAQYISVECTFYTENGMCTHSECDSVYTILYLSSRMFPFHRHEFQHKTKTDLALVPSSQLDKTIKRAVYVTKTTKTKWITMLTVNLLLLWDIAQYTKMYIWHIT